eukprot:1515184-Ditylum_brightwellii.AAC.1
MDKIIISSPPPPASALVTRVNLSEAKRKELGTMDTIIVSSPPPPASALVTRVNSSKAKRKGHFAKNQLSRKRLKDNSHPNGLIFDPSTAKPERIFNDHNGHR